MNELQAAEQNLSKFSGNMIGDIKSEYNRAWSPVLERSANQTRRQMADFLPQFMTAASSGYGGGTSAADLDPTAKLGNMGYALGDLGGRLSRTSQVTDYLGGQMNDLYNQSIQQYGMDYDMAQAAYDRAFGREQLAAQQRAADAQLKLRREADEQLRAQQAEYENQLKISQYGDYNELIRANATNPAAMEQTIREYYPDLSANELSMAIRTAEEEAKRQQEISRARQMSPMQLGGWNTRYNPQQLFSGVYGSLSGDFTPLLNGQNWLDKFYYGL